MGLSSTALTHFRSQLIMPLAREEERAWTAGSTAAEASTPQMYGAINWTRAPIAECRTSIGLTISPSVTPGRCPHRGSRVQQFLVHSFRVGKCQGSFSQCRVCLWTSSIRQADISTGCSLERVRIGRQERARKRRGAVCLQVTTSIRWHSHKLSYSLDK